MSSSSSSFSSTVVRDESGTTGLESISPNSLELRAGGLLFALFDFSFLKPLTISPKIPAGGTYHKQSYYRNRETLGINMRQ